MFYQTFLQLYEINRSFLSSLNDDNSTNNKLTINKLIMKQLLEDDSFRKIVVKKIGPCFDLVRLLEKSLLSKMLKPQELIIDHDDFYIAIDMFTNTYYICYKNLLMIDIDYYKKDTGENKTEDQLLQDIIEYCKLNNTIFRIYRSRNGIHAFLVSKKMDRKSEESINMMLDLGCDFYYTIYSYIRGWSVRVNKKRSDKSDILYELIGDFDKEGLIDNEVRRNGINDELIKLLNVHLICCDNFKDVEPCLMYDG